MSDSRVCVCVCVCVRMMSQYEAKQCVCVLIMWGKKLIAVDVRMMSTIEQCRTLLGVPSATSAFSMPWRQYTSMRCVPFRCNHARVNIQVKTSCGLMSAALLRMRVCVCMCERT